VQLVGPGPANGALNLSPDGSLMYVAATGFTGDDSFEYRLFDGGEYSDPEQVTIHVQDQAPVASPSSFYVWTAQGISGGTANVLANATDPENDPMSAVLVSAPQYASSFNLNADGTFTYVPIPAGFNGVDSFVIQANDGTLNSAPVTVTLNWTSQPVGQNGAYVLGASGQLTVSSAAGVLANVFNPMNASLTTQLEQGIDPSVATLNFNGDGSFTFTAGPAFQGESDFTYGLIQAGYGLLLNRFPIVRILASRLIGASTGLSSVAFNGNATIADDSGGNFDPPQWVAEVAAHGDVQLQDGHKFPISFTRNTTIPLTPTFNIAPNSAFFWGALGNNILVRANSNMFTAAGQPLQLGYSQNVHLQLNANNQLTTQGFVQMDNSLANYTDYEPSLILTWQISPDNGTTWITPIARIAGSTQTAFNVSSNQIFVTLANPNGWDPAPLTVASLAQINGWTPSLFSATGALNLALQKPTIPWTVFYVGIEGGNGLGATTNAMLLADVWSGFTTVNITKPADGTALQYWGGWATPNVSAAQLIAERNGQCYSWAELYVDVLRAWGDAAVTVQNQKRIFTSPGTTQIGVVPVLAPRGGNAPNYFLVGNWQLGAGNIPNIPANNQAATSLLGGYTNYAVIPTDPDNPQTPKWVDTANAQYLWNNGPRPPNGPPAQNNDNPPSAFVDHMLVLIDGVLYDPSYGVTYAYNPATPATPDAPVAGFAAALGGFMTIVPFNNRVYNFNLNGAGLNDNTSYWIALFKPITPSMLTMR
jgi:hypothetical protein